MAVATAGSIRKIDQTPTWAVATVAFVIIAISIVLEKSLRKAGRWFTEKKKRALYEALESIKGELMVLGFISLLTTLFEVYIPKICLPLSVAKSMLPCPYKHDQHTTTKYTSKEYSRMLYSVHRRSLAAPGSLTSYCKKSGYEPMISVEAFHQLHMFITFLALFHVVNSLMTVTLGKLKIRGWKPWEAEAAQSVSATSDGSPVLRLAGQMSFVKSHHNFWNRTRFTFYIVCFFRQFFRSVRKADYLTLRNAFINVHLSPGSTFNFQKYIKRSLEDDFKVVVGVSPLLWATVVTFLLLNVNGWHALLWASLIPLVIILAVGTKLQAIIAQMALKIEERNTIIQGIPLVQVSDKYFWFNSPTSILHLIHFTLFQNAFQMTYFLWIWYEYGLKSCFNEDYRTIIIRVSLGFGVQFLCSYITLPLYALVTQMGSTMKKSVFNEQTNKALENWKKAAVKKNGEMPGRARMTHPSASPATVIKVSNMDHDGLELNERGIPSRPGTEGLSRPSLI